MFGLFKKKKSEPRRYDVTQAEFDVTAFTANLIQTQTDFYHFQKEQQERNKRSPLLSAEYITPWIVGYCVGMLDAISQTKANHMVYTSEMQQLLFSVVFGEDNVINALSMYITCNEVESDSPFYVMNEEYFLGLKKSFNEICEDKTVIGLCSHLISANSLDIKLN
ncbi:hypothetical protein [Morganella psychrotolerans]|uniref:hypothetical protein n=1 Tax=Morganella psychrotolerans TaxID=368603 RepID=UPI0039B0E761